MLDMTPIRWDCTLCLASFERGEATLLEAILLVEEVFGVVPNRSSIRSKGIAPKTPCSNRSRQIVPKV